MTPAKVPKMVNVSSIKPSARNKRLTIPSGLNNTMSPRTLMAMVTNWATTTSARNNIAQRDVIRAMM